MIARIILSIAIPIAATAAAFADDIVSWKAIQAGVEFATITPATSSSLAGPFSVVHIDPSHTSIAVGIASQDGSAPRIAAEWCRTSGFAVATNLGMFNADHRSHTGYLRNGRHENSARWNSYRSVLAVRPRDPSLTPSLWIDLDSPKPPAVLDKYDLVVQNLRLIAGNRKNVWSPSAKRWSEAALAIDSKGRLLFLFSRAPYTMRELNKLLLQLPLDVQQAMHLEGGPEASLSIHVPGLDLDLCGSYETGFLEDESNREQWPLPQRDRCASGRGQALKRPSQPRSFAEDGGALPT